MLPYMTYMDPMGYFIKFPYDFPYGFPSTLNVPMISAVSPAVCPAPVTTLAWERCSTPGWLDALSERAGIENQGGFP